MTTSATGAVKLAGDRLVLRDWQPKDVDDRLRALLAPDRA